jgi:hypothetical protein
LITVLAPREDSSRTIAAPIPEEEPLTIATLSRSDVSIVLGKGVLIDLKRRLERGTELN